MGRWEITLKMGKRYYFCIGSKINGTKDVIAEGTTGYLFETGNARSLADQIEKFLKLTWEEKNEMGKSGRKKIEREYDRQIVVQKYCNEVEKV